MINQIYNLNINPDKVSPIVRVSQYDYNSRNIQFVIYEDDELYDLSGMTAQIKVGENTYQGTIENNIVSFIFNDTDYATKTLGEVVLSNNGTMATLNFYLVVEETPFNANTLNLTNNSRSTNNKSLEKETIENEPILSEKIEINEDLEVKEETEETTEEIEETEEEKPEQAKEKENENE